MSAYNDALNGAAQNAFCDITRAGVAGGLLFTGLTAVTLAGALGGLAVAGVSAHLYASYCGRPPPPPPEPEEEDWEGGQCEDIPYSINIVMELRIYPKTSNIFAGDIVDNFVGIGRVRTVKVVDTGDFDNDIRIYAAWKGGVRDVSVVKGTAQNAENPFWGYSNVRITVTRIDGLPDTCGNPPPILPPDSFENPGDIIYINPEGITINTPVTFDFRGGRFGLNGDFFIPVNITNNLNPTLSFSGTINVNSGNITVNPGDPRAPIGNGSDPGDVFTPPGTPPPPPGNDTPPPPPPKPKDRTKEPEKIIRGVIITTTQQQTDATIIYQDNIPTIYAPALGYVSFLCSVDDALGWSADIPVKNGRQIIECPWRFGAIDVRAQPKPGAIFDVRIVYDIKSL